MKPGPGRAKGLRRGNVADGIRHRAPENQLKHNSKRRYSIDENKAVFSRLNFLQKNTEIKSQKKHVTAHLKETNEGNNVASGHILDKKCY